MHKSLSDPTCGSRGVYEGKLSPELLVTLQCMQSNSHNCIVDLAAYRFLKQEFGSLSTSSGVCVSSLTSRAFNSFMSGRCISNIALLKPVMKASAAKIQKAANLRLQ